MENDLEAAEDYLTGFVNDIDHGLRLRADLLLPIEGCTFCGEDHAAV